MLLVTHSTCTITWPLGTTHTGRASSVREYLPDLSMWETAIPLAEVSGRIANLPDPSTEIL